MGLLAQTDAEFDVIVIGSGMAGTAAALAAWESGARVLVVEKAPRESAGGSSRLSGGGFRFPNGDYTADDLFRDLMLVTRNRGNPALLRTMADRAAADAAWLQTMGLEWVDPTSFRPDLRARRMRLSYARPQPFELHGVRQIGAGNGAIQRLHQTLFERVPVRCELKAERLLVDSKRRIIGVRVYSGADGYQDLKAPTVILASGGFQANPEMRVRYLGRFADEWIVRGTRYNTGDGIRMAMELGAEGAGQWGDFHAPVIDARSARIECGETNVNTYPFTVMVNVRGERFLDEGEDYRDRTYAKFGKAILQQPESKAFLIFDAKVKNLVCGLVETWGPVAAETLADLASKLGLDAEALERTIREFNAAVQPGEFDPARLDGKHTAGLRPPKSNWALPVDTPPFYGFTVTGGITFTFGGLRVDTQARVLDTEGRPIAGLYAAGEILGDFFYFNYPSGSSLVRSTVYGRIAGQEAARAALARKEASALA